MVILVCGSRTYSDKRKIRYLLNFYDPTEVVFGDCTGADAIALGLVKKAGLSFRQYEADWNQYGNAAGPIRNQRMLDEGKPDLVLAFYDGEKTKGTTDMVTKAEKAGVPVQEFGLGRKYYEL